MDIILIILAILNLAAVSFVAVLLFKIAGKKQNGSKKDIAEMRKQLEILNRTSENQNRLMLEQSVRMGESVVNQITVLGGELRNSQENQQKRSVEALEKIEVNMKELSLENRGELEKIRNSNLDSMEKLRRENQESLDRISNTVNEKLQRSLDDKISRSFESVNKRLAEVYEGLGEMKAVASGVSDLKKVLSNVKTRGIMGEIQLGAILAEILAPEQYGEQIKLSPDASERVDFAVKLPGMDSESCVYLPIDSKFPGDTYADLMAAYENGDAAELKIKRTALETEIKRCAKSIRDKYIRPPYTTDFAILFLPFEGLYSEVVNMGLVEYLQREFKVNIAGPSTMAAMLNSLQMGFRTLAIQKKSGEVWKILEEAKEEFLTFEEVLDSARKRLRMADNDLEKLIGTRTRAINRTLKNVSDFSSKENLIDIIN